MEIECPGDFPSKEWSSLYGESLIPTTLQNFQDKKEWGYKPLNNLSHHIIILHPKIA